MSKTPDYIVIRAAEDLPPGFLPAHLDGKWFDRANVPVIIPSSDVAERYPGAVAEPSGRFEVRDDGAVAEVWEMRP